MTRKIIAFLITISTMICMVGCQKYEPISEASSDIILSEPTNDTTVSDKEVSNNQENENSDTSNTTDKSEVKDNSSSNSIPTTSKPTTSKPTTSKPTTSNPTTSKPATSTPTNNVSAGQQALSKAKAKANEQNYLEAMQILKQYLSVNPKDEAVNSKLVEYENLYAQQQIEKSEKVFITPENDYKEALSIITEAVKNAPYNSGLKSKKEYYQSFEPKKVTVFKEFDRYNMRVYDSQEDLLGDIHNGVMYNGYLDDKGYICYVLDKPYNKLTFTYYGVEPGYQDGGISVRDISSGDYDTSTMIFEKQNIKSSALPTEVTIDISGIKIIRFWCSDYVAIADAVVQRTVK